MNATPYPYVNEVLADLLQRAREILGEQFVGMYLYGSLAGGDFNPDRSDIDFVIVTRDLLPQTAVDNLEQMHKELAESGSKWAGKLEGQYIPLQELRRYNPEGPQLPTINEGRFYLAGQGQDWVIQRHVLRERETIVAGPSIRDHIEPVSADDMRDAVTAVLHDWWAPIAADPEWLDGRPDYLAFAVQTMCRVLYTLAHGTAVSKTEAARWAIEALDDEWRDMIQAADAWPGSPPPALDRTLEFIRFVVRAAQSHA
jgi:hypothetical protein